MAALANCQSRVLAELVLEDREAIPLCDLEGLSQDAYACLNVPEPCPGPSPASSGPVNGCAITWQPLARCALTRPAGSVVLSREECRGCPLAIPNICRTGNRATTTRKYL